MFLLDVLSGNVICPPPRPQAHPAWLRVFQKGTSSRVQENEGRGGQGSL